mmetsp:Transcript_986/g.1514  ORF Transcript_986/g.1514 Transcript_986/m.1514 type:complete len:203 (+) Transcript_986:233-841(+)
MNTSAIKRNQAFSQCCCYRVHQPLDSGSFVSCPQQRSLQKWWSIHFENENHDRPMPAVANNPNKCRRHGLQSLHSVKERHCCTKVQLQRAPVKDESPLRLCKLRRFNRFLNKEFHSDCYCNELRDPDRAYGNGYKHDDFNIRFSMPKMEKRGDVENKQGHRKQSPDDRKPAARNQPVNRPCRPPPPNPFAGMSNDEVNSADC